MSVMATSKNHYEVLGVSPRANVEEIRRAYRDRARKLHPDMSPSTNSSVQMTDVNLAWSVLSDERRRREYDATLVISRVSETTTREPEIQFQRSSAPLRFPWRGMLLAAIAGAVLVLIAHSFTDPGPPGAPDQLLTSGSCVNISPQLDVFEVTCSGPHDAVVTQLIATDRVCPVGTEPFRDRQGMGKACVVRAGVQDPVGAG
jgi:molecular chaperone DnaJ